MTYGGARIPKTRIPRNYNRKIDMSENDENKCPTCGATGTNPCLTKSGSAAKKMHATRKIAAKVEEIRETAKQRFDRLKAKRKARPHS